MITPTVKTGQPLLIATKVGINKFIFEYQVSSIKYQVRSTKYNVPSKKYGRNTLEIDSAKPARRGGLREIKEGNTLEIDQASLVKYG